VKIIMGSIRIHIELPPTSCSSHCKMAMVGIQLFIIAVCVPVLLVPHSAAPGFLVIKIVTNSLLCEKFCSAPAPAC
jgi:hypothetical protein